MTKTIEQKVLNFIRDNKLIEVGDNVLVAFSGGPDSVFLVEFLLKFKRRLKINIAAFHLNHKFRGKEADEDERFCKKYSSEKNVEYFSSSKNVKLFAGRNKLSLEEAGRKLRYEELLRLAANNHFSKIAVAHNLDDNTETVLLNLIKGTGLKGLSGIPVKRGKIIRPVLAISKMEILEYLNQKKLEYRFDSSNITNDYERNYLRNEIIPYITGRLNPKLNYAVFRTSEIVREFSEYLDEQTSIAFGRVLSYENKRLIFNLSILKNIDSGLLGNLLREAIKKYFEIELENKNVHDLKALIEKQSGKQIKFTNGITAFRDRESIIIFTKGRETARKSVKLKMNEKVRFEGKTIEVNDITGQKLKFKSSRQSEIISADKIKGDLVLRKWKNGDRFIPLGMKNSKKVSDFLNEQKVDSLSKKGQLVLTNSGNIVWMVGLRIDDRYKITDKTVKRFKLSIKNK